MKITNGMIFDLLKYWLKEGKTMTALLTGAALIFFGSAEIDLTPEQVEMVKELIPAAVLLAIGFLDDVRKGIAGFLQYKKKAESVE